MSRPIKNTELDAALDRFKKSHLPGEDHASFSFAYSLMQETDTPACIIWGEEHFFFCNQAFVPFLPSTAVYGTAVPDSWPEFWEILSASVQQVFKHGYAMPIQHPLTQAHTEKNATSFTCTFTPLTGAADISGVLLHYVEAPVKTEPDWSKRTIEVERKFENLVFQSPIATSVFRGPGFVIELANEEALKLWGKDRSVIGKTIAEVFPELAEQGYMDMLNEVYHRGVSHYGNEMPALLQVKGKMQKVYVTFIYKPLHDFDGNVNGILCMGYNVSDHVEAREKLEQAEERASMALQAGNMGTFDVNLPANTIIASKKLHEIFGIKQGTLSRELFAAMLHPDDVHIREAAHEEALKTGLLHYEARLLLPGKRIKWINAQGRYFYDDNHKPIRLVGVVRDITDQRNIDKLIENAEIRFRETVKNAPVGIAIFTGPDFITELANTQYLRLLDRTEQELLGSKLFDVIPEAEQNVAPIFKEIYQSGEVFEASEFEVTLNRHHTFQQAFFNLVYQPIKNEQGEVYGILVIASEVTQQVHARHAIAEREQTFSNMLMRSPIAMTIWRGPEYVIEIANHVMIEKIWRKKPEEVIGKKALEVFPELLDQKYPQLLEKVFNEGVTHTEKESIAYVLGNDGMRKFYLDFEYSPFRERSGIVAGIMITVNDVTEQVEARQKTEDAEARMRMALDGTGTATWDLDLLTYEIIYSSRLAEIFGYERTAELTHAQMRSQLMPADQEEIVLPAFEKALREGIYSYEARIVLPDQRIRWIKTLGKVIYDGNGQPKRMLGTMTDITDRMESDNKLLHLASIVQSTDDAIISKTVDGLVTSWNKGAEKLFGYTEKEMLGHPITVLFPPDRLNEELEILNCLKAGRRMEHYETIRVDKAGNYINVSLTVSPLKNAQGKLIGISKIAHDITAKKLTEKVITETKEKLQIVIDASQLGMWELNLQTGEITTSERYLEIMGMPGQNEVPYKTLKKLLHPDDAAARSHAFKTAFTAGDLHYETRLIWPDQSVHWVETRGKVFYDTNHQASKMIGTIRDITEERQYQQRIEDSEQRFRVVADTAPVMIWMVGTDKKYTFLNKAWLNFTGLTIEDENAGEFTKGLHSDDYNHALEVYLDAFDKREPFYLEYRLRRHDGEYRWISDTGTPQFSSNGIFEGYIGACMDIHDRIIFEEKLKESESRLRIAALSSEMGTWSFNPVTSSLFWDNASRQLCGVDESEPVTMELFWECMHPDDRKNVLAKMKQALDPDIAELYDVEYRITGLPDNKERWLHAKGKAMFNEDKQPYVFSGTILDITEKRLALEDLKESEQKFRLLADSMPQLIWTSDEHGNLNYFNQSVYDYSGKSPEQLATEGWLQIVHPEDQEENMHQWNRAIETGKPFLFEHRFRKFDGEYRWQLSRAVPQRDEKGVIQKWVGTSTDIHDQKTFVKELEHQVALRTHELKQSNEELVKSNDELAQFAYVASHDLQEPLRKIQTFATRIVDSEGPALSDRGKDYFNRIQSASARMQQLIIDLLSFSRANTKEKHFEVADLNVLLKVVLDQMKEMIQQKGAIITADRLPVMSVIAYQFEQLLTNVLSNALKFSRPGVVPEIRITYAKTAGTTLDLFAIDKTKMYHHIRIADNGIGFDNEYNERIFQVFQRLHGRDKFEGTGIGLAIVKRIMDNHNGAVIASGKENEGAVFDFYLPVND